MMLPSASPKSETRLTWVDTLKGIGIACVVYGHVANGNLASEFVYMFHMPLFSQSAQTLFLLEPSSAK
jgi:uncharacterized membrane protein YcfT